VVADDENSEPTVVRERFGGQS
jgi:hypothetical protein